MKKIILVLFFSCLSCAQGPDLHPPVETVQFVEIERYMGKWYEIARLPQSFQRNCGATQAIYQLRNDGRVNVTNRCQNIKRPGRINEANAIARVVNSQTNAELKVSFVPILRYFNLFSGDYWILELGKGYEFAMVGSPNRKTLWILSRTPTISDSRYQELVNRAKDQGFPVEDLVKSPVWQ